MADRQLPRLVIVSGAPGTGKTTLALALAEALHLPLVVRDAIKEGMHVTVDSVDPAERGRFGADAFAVFYDVLGQLLQAGVSVVAEAAFHGERASVDLAPLVDESRAVLIHCKVDEGSQHRATWCERGPELAIWRTTMRGWRQRWPRATFHGCSTSHPTSMPRVST